ncbi:glutamate mutase L [Clostridium aminobutyricum]|uniref:Glutamate mutase L n=1 Tax=Clostridium aminobutyricum TaxID=33953 RepID=A0A939D9X3_CLOAM|nr:glutamate mutase L [Clostridium aminobutyricum]MBN7774094.1 glutamate mutase L [Clostridium aminobutyricum]
MDTAILIDFGSTFTKAAVADLEKGRIIYTFKTPSTVSTDAKIGLDICYDKIREKIGTKQFEHSKKLATSSAAGGLRMVVVGLTETLSITAGRNAAFGAGAKILKSYSGALTEADIREMESMNMEIILFCGGYEGGNTQIVRHNAAMLGGIQTNTAIPIIYAGNSELMKEIKIIFYQKHKELFVVNNIIPNVGLVESQATVDLIRNIFLERIINMKGLEQVKSELDSIVMPTPAAVLEAGELLSLGCEEEPGLGPLMIVDIGGATTDIHTYCISTAVDGAKMIGVQEPFAKRTVEGDLGMRESCGLTIQEAGISNAASDLHITEEDVNVSISRRLENIEFLPKDDPETCDAELKFDQQIAKYACRFATRRHTGNIENVHSKICTKIQRGKNLIPIETIIGTGGPIVNSHHPREILEQAFKTEQDDKLKILLPETARLMIDRDYVFYAAGMLRQINPKAALKIMKNSLVNI